jgi:Chitobiase/beta-hexosaminidase C-terminal domain
MFNYLLNFSTSGSNVTTTGTPWPDVFAEDANFNITSPSSGYSMKANTAGALSAFGECMAIYEANYGAYLFGQTPTTTQLEQNQLGASVGEALATEENFMLLQRDSQVTGPINLFVYAQDEKGTSSGGGEIPLWGGNRTNACGPGQLSSCTDYLRPDLILQSLWNGTIGVLPNLMSTSQSGTPTYSYAGGQAGGCCSYSIASNSAVPYQQCTSHASGSNWATACYNNNLTASATVTISGAGSPTGTVTQYIYPNSGETLISNNENTYNGSGTIAPEDTLPSSTTTSGTTMTIPPGSVAIWTYSTSGTPQADTPTFSPAAGTYAGTQTVTLSNPSSAPVVCYSTTGSPATNGSTGCTTGTVYSGPLTVSSSETIYAVAGGTGYADSSVGTAVYVISATAAGKITGGVLTGGVLK